MSTIQIDARTAETLLNYLATKPWGEVQGLIPPLLSQLEAAVKAEQAAKAPPHLAAVQPGQPGQEAA